VVALVSASVFDAVNGIEPRFQPLHVKPAAPHNASQRAAAIQAAYVILVDLYQPQQSATLKAQRDASIAALASTEKAQSIAAGVAWGQTVADAIWAWRLTDGIAPAPPPFLGVQSIVGTHAAIGAWRPTPQGLPNQLPGVSGAGTTIRHDDAVGADAAIAVPFCRRHRRSTARTTLMISTNCLRWASTLDRGATRISRIWRCFGRGTRHFTGIALPPSSLWNAGCRSTRMHTYLPCECLDGRRRNRVLG